MIKAARAEVPNSLLFDNGDLLQGNLMGDYVAKIMPLKDGETHPAYRVMNQLGYDAANIGNHEFNYGLDFLYRSLKGANFPYVNANVYVDDKDSRTDQAKHAFTPYVMLDRQLVDAQGKTHAIKVGVIGFAPPQIMQWDRGHLEGRVELTVEDNGSGLPPNFTGGSGGMGLRVMQYRAGLIGGTLHVGPRPGGGVSITCAIAPLRAPRGG